MRAVGVFLHVRKLRACGAGWRASELASTSRGRSVLACSLALVSLDVRARCTLTVVGGQRAHASRASERCRTQPVGFAAQSPSLQAARRKLCRHACWQLCIRAPLSHPKACPAAARCCLLLPAPAAVGVRRRSRAVSLFLEPSREAASGSSVFGLSAPAPN